MSITELPQVEELEQDDELETIPTLPSEPVPRKAVLLRAAELVDQHGYAAYALGSPENGFCILGAVLHAGNEFGCDVGRDWYDWSSRLIGTAQCDAYGWSDSLSYHPRYERSGLFGKREVPEAERLSAALRSLADGKSWDEATRRA